MDKLIYLFFLLILFISSLNNKLLIPSIFIYVGLCIYFKKKRELIFGLIIIYMFSIYYNKKVEKFYAGPSSSSISGPSSSSISGPSSSSISGPTSSISEEKNIFITSNDYNDLMFVFKSLLDKSYLDNNISKINDTLSEYDIVNVYQLGDSILNKLNNKKFNNLLEKITCIDSNGDINYLDTDNINYKKLYAFSELIMIYAISIDKVIELINVHDIYRLCDLDKNNKILIENGKYGYEYNGLLFYLNINSINHKYYKLLELLELDTLLDNQNKSIKLSDRLFNYSDDNKHISKDLNSLLVLFDYYKILDETRLDNEEDDFELDYSLLRNIDLNKKYWEFNPYFKQYKIKEKIINKINAMTKEDKNIFKHELNDKFKPTTSSVIDKQEYKVLKKDNDIKKSKEFLEELNLKNMKNRFVEVFIDIINDFSTLYSKRCSIDCDSTKNLYYDRFMFYFNNIIQILIKDGRMFYVGIFIIFFSFVLYFIEVSK